jgi:hypothetical protein
VTERGTLNVDIGLVTVVRKVAHMGGVGSLTNAMGLSVKKGSCGPFKFDQQLSAHDVKEARH